METKLAYMQRRLKEYREMKPEKTLLVQRDFPNCQKYKKCCRIDKPFWDELEAKLKDISYIKQPFRLKEDKKNLNLIPPKDFVDDYVWNLKK